MNAPGPFSCPLPAAGGGTVLLGHGSGGKLSAQLLQEVFLPAFGNPALQVLGDAAVIATGAGRLAITTDSFVVKPLFFPGGDIGSLAVHGTLNDLAVSGARPLCLTAAFILEEGLEMNILRAVVGSMAAAAADAGVPIVAGDTKVVEKGSGDGLFINTAGIGLVPEGVLLSPDRARAGDTVLLSGTIGDHGIAILARREGLEFDTELRSDSAALHTLTAAMLDAAPAGVIRCMRDPTRGGLSATLNEIAGQSRVGIEIREGALPVREEVRGACEMLGLDPLYVANEGKLVAVVEAKAADTVLAAMRSHPLGGGACVVGTVRGEEPGMVTMKTVFGTTRIVDTLAGDQLPRIC